MAASTQPAQLAQLFAGKIRELPPDGVPTGFFKTPVDAPVWVGREGLAGDVQADRRVHGGPEKAVHQYAVANYARLARAFPAAAGLLLPGSLAENVSVAGWTEEDVAIGDRFRLGEAVIEVCQPRTPCWKIDRRFGVEGMMRFIAQTGLTGWYFRVLSEGYADPRCAFTLLERDAQRVTIGRFLALWREDRPDRKVLERIAAHPALSPNWVAKINERIEQQEAANIA
jgi:MOSC domain-containing protein YiiM